MKYLGYFLISIILGLTIASILIGLLAGIVHFGMYMVNTFGKDLGIVLAGIACFGTLFGILFFCGFVADQIASEQSKDDE